MPAATRIATEGRTVRKNWYAAWAAAFLMAGSAGSAATAAGFGWGQEPAPNQYGQPAPQPSWTERVVNPFGLGGTPAERQQRDAAEAAQAAEAQRLKFDPLALQNGNGEPTPELLTSMGDLCCHGGNVDQARQLYQKALALEPRHLPALLGAARMEDREGRMDVAAMLYERAAAAYPNNPTVLNDLGLCLARQGQLPAAERALARAVQLQPAKALYRNNMAKVQVELNRLDVACEHLAAVHAVPIVNYNMGVLLYERGRVAEAERYLTAAATMDPRLEGARALLAQMRRPGPAYQVARAEGPASSSSSVTTAPANSGTSVMTISPAVPTISSSAAVAPPTVTPTPITPTPSSAPQMMETLTPTMPTVETAPMLLPPIN
jgi:Flp pilus assembly protein TadD